MDSRLEKRRAYMREYMRNRRETTSERPRKGAPPGPDAVNKVVSHPSPQDGLNVNITEVPLPDGMKLVEQAKLIGSGVERFQIRGMKCRSNNCKAPSWCYEPQHPTLVHPPRT